MWPGKRQADISIPSSLGLVGDMDDVDLIEDVEAAFGYRFADSELESCETVGDFFRLVEARLSNDHSQGKCATAMCFYRLRRAIQPRLGLDLRPQTPISQLKALPARELNKVIEYECGLRPLTLCLSNWVKRTLLLLLVITAFAWALPPFILLMGGQKGVWLAEFPWWITVSSAIAASLLLWKSPRQLPKNLDSFGDLARVVTYRNIGRLSKSGARLGRSEAWTAFRHILTDHTDIPKQEIVPETLILAPSKT